jgi:hypothetical protein
MKDAVNAANKFNRTYKKEIEENSTMEAIIQLIYNPQ